MGTSIFRNANKCLRLRRCAGKMQRLRSDTAVPDITFLSGHEMGHALVNEFEQRDVHVINTFGQDDRESRRKKLAFFQGDARVKATTLHSFKGWEARHLVLYVSTIASPEDCALLYTALTRLKKHQQGRLAHGCFLLS